jgi:hypothetical protein
MTTHVGTGLFCLVRFINLFLREVFFRAGICDFRINFLWFLSVGLHAGMHAYTSKTVLYADMNQMTRAVSISLKHQYPSLSASGAAFSVSMTAD